jgi:hypothetical protein
LKIENFPSLIFELSKVERCQVYKQLNICRLALVLGLAGEYFESMKIDRFCGNLCQFAQTFATKLPQSHSEGSAKFILGSPQIQPTKKQGSGC